jgi:hypothetical protein
LLTYSGSACISNWFDVAIDFVSEHIPGLMWNAGRVGIGVGAEIGGLGKQLGGVGASSHPIGPSHANKLK